VLIPRTVRAWSSRFGDLSGIANLVPPRRIEALPYVASDATFNGESRDRNNPFDNGKNLQGPEIMAWSDTFTQARPDGDWCGVNEELGVLSETGCYADYTFPSAPSPTQPRRVNAIYRARDTGKPRAADDGVRVRAGGRDQDGLMIVQGPLALDWRRRKCGVLPRLENGELSGVNPPTGGRASLWMRQAVGVAGRADWIFVKVHTHGCVDANAAVLLGDSMAAFHEALARMCGEVRCRLHYATAREMFNMIRAAEDGEVGSPGAFRDFEVRAPAAAVPA
jgi:hypothetical protein